MESVSLKKVLLVVTTVFVLAPAIAHASHRFTDVPTGHTFHDDITWLADQGITRGCNPPANTQFCPDEPVTRGQMAAFLRRFNDVVTAGTSQSGVGLGITGRDVADGPVSGNGVVLALNLNIPEPGIVVLEASSSMENQVESDAALCGINIGGATNTAVGDSWRIVDLTVNVFETCATQTAIAVTAGTQPARLVVAEALSTTDTFEASLIATFYALDTTIGLLDHSLFSEVPARSLDDDTPAKGG